QRNLNEDKVRQYYLAHRALAPWLDRIGAFDVFASVWFSAIYLLLFTSLVGCLVPRLRGQVVALVRVPPEAPSRLDRLPVHRANRVVVPGEDQSFCNTLQQYDDYGLGARVAPGDLEPFCLTLDDFQARYLDTGEPADFRAAVTYTVGDRAPEPAVVKVNDPLR